MFPTTTMRHCAAAYTPFAEPCVAQEARDSGIEVGNAVMARNVRASLHHGEHRGGGARLCGGEVKPEIVELLLAEVKRAVPEEEEPRPVRCDGGHGGGAGGGRGGGRRQ
ncbi:hypothetical protein SEVIR_6G115850v4 [Setaria viridis]